MAITVYEACKKRKRTPNIFTISYFAAASSFAETAMDFGRSFRENIREFLKRCSETEDYTVVGNPVWWTLLVSESSGGFFPLYIVEEDVENSSLPQPLCDLCRFFEGIHGPQIALWSCVWAFLVWEMGLQVMPWKLGSYEAGFPQSHLNPQLTRAH